jgi:3-methyl-2-oxobutanoate hydroxymethyltransferase
MLVADMPYLSFHLSVEDTLRNAGGFIQRGAQAVKLEGGTKRLPMIHALLDAEIPVMGHLGLTPQSVNPMGGFKVQGKQKGEALRLLEDAQKLQDAGCFGMVLEGIPADLAAKITETIEIPTIGIGAGPQCSGQVLVFHDVLGLLPGTSPKFVRRYAEGFEELCTALAAWAEDVRGGGFPDGRESYTLPEAVRPALIQWRPQG